MPNHFTNCYTSDEIKIRYRQLAKLLHPDAGGTAQEFRDLKSQYDYMLSSVSREPPLPSLYRAGIVYFYHKHPVTFYEADNHYYKFHKEKGADVWIDSDHTYLIKQQDYRI